MGNNDKVRVKVRNKLTCVCDGYLGNETCGQSVVRLSDTRNHGIWPRKEAEGKAEEYWVTLFRANPSSAKTTEFIFESVR